VSVLPAEWGAQHGFSVLVQAASGLVAECQGKRSVRVEELFLVVTHAEKIGRIAELPSRRFERT